MNCIPAIAFALAFARSPSSEIVQNPWYTTSSCLRSLTLSLAALLTSYKSFRYISGLIISAIHPFAATPASFLDNEELAAMYMGIPFYWTGRGLNEGLVKCEELSSVVNRFPVQRSLNTLMNSVSLPSQWSQGVLKGTTFIAYPAPIPRLSLSPVIQSILARV